tara:strand:+ start:3738 stop:4184 length:447 start_codon:yes stop_codon:yes gene_type:complete
MNGSSDIQVNDMGTSSLHQRHKTVLEPSEGSFLRVRVTDQLFIDKLLLKKTITMDQHYTAEWILRQAVRANVYLKSPSMDSGFSGGKAKDKYSNNLLIFSRTLKRITTKFGYGGEKLAFDLIVNNLETNDEKQIKKLIEILIYMGKRV